jgi:spore germination cell wall hydrolase CwlJ-like protein
MGIDNPKPNTLRQKTDRIVDGFNKLAAVISVVGGPMVLAPKAAASQKPNVQVESQISDQMRLKKMLEEIEESPVNAFGPEFFSEADLKCLTDNVYHEARGEPEQGRYAVIFSTLSRVLDSKYPDTICGVVHQPWQFSWTMDKKILAQALNPRTYLQIAAQVASLMRGRTVNEAAIISGMQAGLPHGSIFYKRAGFIGSPKVQAFFATLQSVGIVGNHEFFAVKK